MNAKPTPGSWHWAEAESIIHHERGVITDEDGYIIARCEREHARLIAAAPDLDAEVIGILRHFDRDNIPVNQEERPSGAGIRVFLTYRQADRLRAAIAKARGGA